MQKPQTFINRFMCEASHFGLHLDESADNLGPFSSIDGKLCVSRVLDLRDTFVYVLETGHILAIDASIGMDAPARWTIKAVATVEELAEFIKLRRTAQSGNWD